MFWIFNEIDRKGRFNPEKAKELNLPVKCWGLLQKGETIIYEDKKYTPDMVMGERRKGLKVTYTTDTRPVQAIVEAATGADLFICEACMENLIKKQKLENISI